jgi:predicted DNA-binding transcriptional regulator AlpA
MFGKALRIIGYRETENRVHLKQTQIREKIAAGEFPQPVKPSASGRAVGFLEHEVDAYILTRVAARDQGLDRPSKKEQARREIAGSAMREANRKKHARRKELTSSRAKAVAS